MLLDGILKNTVGLLGRGGALLFWDMSQCAIGAREGRHERPDEGLLDVQLRQRVRELTAGL